MYLNVISPYGKLFSEEVDGFYIDTNSGVRGILDSHTDFVSFFDFSEVEILGKQEKLYVALGYVYVKDDEAFIISQFADKDKSVVKKAYEKLTRKKNGDNDDGAEL